MAKKDKPSASANGKVGTARPAGTMESDEGLTSSAVPTPDMAPAKGGGDSKDMDGPRLRALFDVAQEYGNRSFENYARIRSLAETIRDELCGYLTAQGPCVFLVPPEGRFSAQNYQSAAFSVAGQGYLPLTPISFGLAIRVSEDQDYMRIKLTCRKEGGLMFVRLEKGEEIRVPQPVEEHDLEPLLEAIYDHIVHFFQDRIDDYDNGRYGMQEIGFDIQRMSG